MMIADSGYHSLKNTKIPWNFLDFRKKNPKRTPFLRTDRDRKFNNIPTFISHQPNKPELNKIKNDVRKRWAYISLSN